MGILCGSISQIVSLVETVVSDGLLREEAVVESQAMDGRGDVRRPKAIVHYYWMLTAAIRDDRT
jgi:hypothetical protein